MPQPLHFAEERTSVEPLPIENEKVKDLILSIGGTIYLLVLHPIVSARRPRGNNLVRLVSFHLSLAFLCSIFWIAVLIYGGQSSNLIQLVLTPLVICLCPYLISYLLACLFCLRLVAPIAIYRSIAFSQLYIFLCVIPIIGQITFWEYMVYYVISLSIDLKIQKWKCFIILVVMSLAVLFLLSSTIY